MVWDVEAKEAVESLSSSSRPEAPDSPGGPPGASTGSPGGRVDMPSILADHYQLVDLLLLVVMGLELLLN